MGTHGESPPPSWSLGSITHAVIRRAPGSVLAVPPGGSEADLEVPPFRRALAAFDFSEPARRMLDRVAGLLHATEAEVTLLHVLEWLPAEGRETSPGFQISECQLDLAEVTASRLGRALQDSALAARPYQAEVAAGVPHREILRVAAQRRADLIALGLHSRRALDHGFGLDHLASASRIPLSRPGREALKPRPPWRPELLTALPARGPGAGSRRPGRRSKRRGLRSCAPVETGSGEPRPGRCRRSRQRRAHPRRAHRARHPPRLDEHGGVAGGGGRIRRGRVAVGKGTSGDGAATSRGSWPGAGA